MTVKFAVQESRAATFVLRISGMLYHCRKVYGLNGRSHTQGGTSVCSSKCKQTLAPPVCLIPVYSLRTFRQRYYNRKYATFKNLQSCNYA